MAKKIMVCRVCDYAGPVRIETPGSFLIEVVLWIFFIVPGVIYSLWRHASRREVCRNCGSRMMIPPGSPVLQHSNDNRRPHHYINAKKEIICAETKPQGKWRELYNSELVRVKYWNVDDGKFVSTDLMPFSKARKIVSATMKPAIIVADANLEYFKP